MAHRSRRRRTPRPAVRLADRLHLLPVTQQHDRHQRGELPPEVQVEPAETRGHRRRVRNGDRHRDQQHHPGLTVADLAHSALEEGPAGPQEHDRAKHRADPFDAWEVERVAEPVHDHVARHHEGDGQDQRDPEAAPEHLRVVACVLVVPRVVIVPGMLVVTGVLRCVWFMRRRRHGDPLRTVSLECGQLRRRRQTAERNVAAGGCW